ncbi:MAG: cysteine hydrolase family protein [Thermodesulfobacteriota bacterium]
MSKPEPILPQPQSVTITVEKSALLVLDISQRCADPNIACHKLGPRMKTFLDRARDVGLPIIYTISTRLKGTPEGQVYSVLERRPSEPVIFPNSFDKFAGGELQSFLSLFDVDTLIITGYRSNVSVLNTATKATRELKYKVVIPIDGLAAETDYEQQYTLFQFTVLPTQAAELFTFTTLDTISFR